jgi:hypothetical protein
VRLIRFSVGTGVVYCMFCPWNSAAMSICIYSMAVTIFVVFVVVVDVSNCSICLILLRKFSTL